MVPDKAQFVLALGLILGGCMANNFVLEKVIR